MPISMNTRMYVHLPDLAGMSRALVVTHFGKWQLRETLNSAHSEQRHVRAFRGDEHARRINVTT